jgi:hypothetical protein
MIKQFFKDVWFYIRPLLCDNGGGFSFGRVAGWIVLYKILDIVQVVKDLSGVTTVTEIPTYLFYSFLILLAYNFSKKEQFFINLIHAYNGNDVKLAEIEASKGGE